MPVSQPTWVATFGSAVPIVSGLLTNANADLGLIGCPADWMGYEDDVPEKFLGGGPS
jgi:hypothetical protein